ncbi:MAG: ester cyclase [Chloroflexota bacterium]
MTLQTKTHFVQSWIDQIWNKNQLDRLATFHPETFLNEGHTTTHEQIQSWHERSRAVYPDLIYTVEEVVESENHVTIRWSATGTHQGSLWGFIPPTGKKISWSGIHLVRIQDNLIVEVWASANILTQLQQMGVNLQPDAAS